MDIHSYKSQQKILVAVDCIIFGFDGLALKALLIKRGFEPQQGKWSLMGGFIDKDEDADHAAARVLHKLTGMNNVFMEQLYTFTDIHRDAAGRVISIAYYALINIDEYSEVLQEDHEAKWFHLSRLPELIFDHQAMVLKAQAALREKVARHPIGFELLPPKFTLPQLQCLYEAIYEEQLDKRNFSKRMLSLGILNKLAEKEKKSSRRGAFYYVFDSGKYENLKASEVRFV